MIKLQRDGWENKNKLCKFSQKLDFHSVCEFWLALTLTFWKCEASGTNAFNLVQIFDLIIDRRLAFLIHEDKTIWPFCITAIVMIGRPWPLFFEEMWHLAPSNHIKNPHPVLYSLSVTDCPIWRYPEILLFQWVWMTTSFLMTVYRLADAILMSLALQWYCSDSQDLFLNNESRFQLNKEITLKSQSRLHITWHPTGKIRQEAVQKIIPSSLVESK